MLDYFLNYPLGHYLKAMTLPAHPPKVGFFLSRDHGRMLVKKHGVASYWNGALQETPGSPNLQIFEEEEPDVKTPTPYRREIHRELGLGKNNPINMVVDHPDFYLSVYSVTSFETAEDLLNALTTETSSVISNWRNLAGHNDYIWEVLSLDLQTLRGPVRLPKKVILCGFPLEKAENAARWAAAQKGELCNIVPVAIQLLRWAPTVEDSQSFFLVAQTNNEVVMAQYETRALRSILILRTKDGITADEVNDLNEMVEEGNGRESILLCWGVLPGSAIHTRLQGRYSNMRMLTAESLRDITSIPSADSLEKIQNEEAWLLNHLAE